MNNLIKVLIGCAVSQLGTMIGAVIGVFDNNPTDKYLGFLISISGGLMLSVVSFDLIPEGIRSISYTMFYLILFIGILFMYFLDAFLGEDKADKLALLTAISLSIHNFPEGVIMGIGFGSRTKLGLKMCFTIGIHDIPEGLAVAAPLYSYKKKRKKAVMYAYLTSLTTPIGAIIGNKIALGKTFLGLSYGLAAGIMLYVVIFEMLPQGFKLGKTKKTAFGILIGYLLGFTMSLF
ncbi:MAG: ZIP family metal transporter [Bacillota bacterium]|nr:ZIP family metal transporter [Bacillota bacterium]